MTFQSSSALRFGRKVTFVFAMEPYVRLSRKKKSPVGDGGFLCGEHFWGRFGNIVVSRSLHGPLRQGHTYNAYLVRAATEIPPDGNF